MKPVGLYRAFHFCLTLILLWNLEALLHTTTSVVVSRIRVNNVQGQIGVITQKYIIVLMLATVAAADSVKVQKKNYSVFIQVNLDMTDSVGPGKLVRHMQNPSYTYDEYLICIGLGPSISSVICKNPSYSGPSYPSSPVYSKAEPHAMYAIYKQTRKLCVLKYSFYPDLTCRAFCGWMKPVGL